MATDTENSEEKILTSELEKLGKRERRVINYFLRKKPLSKNINNKISEERTFGERVADTVATFGGSWTFIFIFAGILIFWVILNSFILVSRNESFDPYPYILLNLFLSMLAAIQAPIIMMSQNRQAARDRIDAAHDYEINLKSELEIQSLHEKIDELNHKKWLELIEIQQQQINLLEMLLKEQIKLNKEMAPKSPE